MKTILDPTPGSDARATVRGCRVRDHAAIRIDLEWGSNARRAFLAESRDGKPSVAEGDGTTVPGVQGGHQMDRPLTRILSGRWAAHAIRDASRRDDALPRYEPTPSEVGEWARLVRAAVREAIPDAGFTPAFADALDACSRWSRGPAQASVGPLFADTEAGQALRDRVRANPLLSEILFRAACDPARSDGRHPLDAAIEAAGIDPQVAALLGGPPWDDPDLVYAVARELNGGEQYERGILNRALLGALPGLRPDTVPRTPGQARAFCRIAVALAREENGGVRVSEPARLVAAADGDWELLDAEWREVSKLAGVTRDRLARLDWLLDRPAGYLSRKVLLPIQAMAGTIDPPVLGHHVDPPDELAGRIVAGDRGIRELLGIARLVATASPGLNEAMPDDRTADPSRNPDAQAWPALFPPTRVDGLVLSCVRSPLELARVDMFRGASWQPSVRALAAMGCAHVVVAHDRDGPPDAPPVAAFVVRWRGGRWSQADPVLVGGDPQARQTAMAALEAGLATLPPAPRPSYWPVPVAEMVRDVCGYDWEDRALLDYAAVDLAPYLPGNMRSMKALTAAVRAYDDARPAPSDGRPGHPFHDPMLSDLVDIP